VSDPPPPSAEDVEKSAGRPADGGAPHPDPLEGRSRSFRERQARRKSARREHVGQLLVVVIIVLGIVTIVTARPQSSSSISGYPSPGPPIAVQFGTPSAGTLSCTGGGTAYTERIPWEGSTQQVTTGDVYVRVYEIWDGDYVGDPGAVANATPSNLCAGTPPDSNALWYVVLTAPNGTNLLTYTAASAWVSLTHEPWNIPIEGGFSLVLVTGESLAGTGRGFAVGGFANGSPINGAIPL